MLAGADGLRTMVNDYENPLFKAGRTFQIGALTPPEAEALITEPVAKRVTYTKQAIQAIQHATANHPYYLQLLCQTLIMILNQKKSVTVTITEVNQAIEYISKAGDDDFAYVWNITSKKAHLMLAIMAQEMNGAQWIPIERIEEILKREHIQVSAELLDDAVRELVEKDVLAEQQATLEYTIPMGLLQSWVTRYKPLKKVRRELI